jgi:myo-inositol catabolism protein IolS
VQYKTLGNISLDISRIALGCWPFAGGAYWGEQDDNDSIATVHAALAAGITTFDTAEGYGDGRSEEVLGRALVGRRSKAVIATKLSSEHLAAAGVVEACERSLRRLQTDYIDLYQIHWPNHDIPLAETLGALDKLQKQGKLRAFSVCNFSVKDMADYLKVTRLITNQLPYSLLWRVIEREIRPMCADQNIGIICYSPLAQGVLTGRYASAAEVPDGLARTRLYSSARAMSRHGEAGCETQLFAAVAEVRKIAGELGQPMGNVALAWVLQQPRVLCALLGARTPRELAEDLPAAELRLSDDVLQRLSAATQPVKEYLGANPDMWMHESRLR